MLLAFCLVEPRRAAIDAQIPRTEPLTDAEWSAASEGSGVAAGQDHANRAQSRPPCCCWASSSGRISWRRLPELAADVHLSEISSLDLSFSGFTSTFWPLASLPGAVLGGVAADWAVERWRGGRIRRAECGADPGGAVRVPDRMVDVGAGA